MPRSLCSPQLVPVGKVKVPTCTSCITRPHPLKGLWSKPVILQVLLTRTPYGELVAVKYASQGKEGVLAHEARMQARLAHVGIARLAAVVVATCTLDPRALVVSGLVMEHCAGGSLAEWLEWNASVGGAPLPFERRLDIADQIFAALEHMHSRGVCHLDLKPCNVMLQHRDLAAAAPQQLKLIDFGLSQLDDRRFMAGRYRGTVRAIARHTFKCQCITCSSCKLKRSISLRDSAPSPHRDA
jgi:serine/threonine protein kinase